MEVLGGYYIRSNSIATEVAYVSQRVSTARWSTIVKCSWPL